MTGKGVFVVPSVWMANGKANSGVSGSSWARSHRCLPWGTGDRGQRTLPRTQLRKCTNHEVFLHADRGLTSATGAATLMYVLAILASHHLIMSWCQILGSRGNNVCNGAGALWPYVPRSLLLKRHSEARVRVATLVYELQTLNHGSTPRWRFPSSPTSLTGHFQAARLRLLT